jgi:hypothetical protein
VVGRRRRMLSDHGDDAAPRPDDFGDPLRRDLSGDA